MHEAKRLEKLVRNSIAMSLLQAPRECGMVTITGIEISKDIQYAKVFISALMEPKKALAYMQKRQKSLQHILRTQVDQRVPELRFMLDPLTERGERIELLLQDS